MSPNSSSSTPSTSPSTPSTTLPDGTPTSIITADVGADGSIRNPSNNDSIGQYIVGPNGGLALTLSNGLTSVVVGSNGQTFVEIPSSGYIPNGASYSASVVFTNDIGGIGDGASITVNVPIPGTPADVVFITNPDLSAVGIGIGIGGSIIPSASIGHEVNNPYSSGSPSGGSSVDQVFKFKDDSVSADLYNFQLQGADHDSISLPSTEFTNLAQVLHNTSMSDGNAVITRPDGETITLVGTTKKELYNQYQDFRFHP